MVYNHSPCPAGPERNNQALVAQMDRVLASEAKGRGFDSRRARHIFEQPTLCGLFSTSKASPERIS